jgi:hypothetical protein
MNIIDSTTHASECAVIYRDESGETLRSNHNTREAAIRFIRRVLAVRHYGPFAVVSR